MPLDAFITPIDNVTDLLKVGDELGIRWDGCFYGPGPIEKLASGELRKQCQAKLDDPATDWKEVYLVDPDDGLGYRVIELSED